MLNKLKAAGLVVALAGAGFLAAPASAQERAPVILILDQAQVLSQSKVGQSIEEQLAALQETARTELNDEVAKLTKEAEDLKKQRDLLSEEVWTQRAQQVAVKQNNLPVIQEVKLRELGYSRQKALNDVNEVMLPILKEIVETNGATLLLERSAVMYAAQETDITQQVIKQLDKKLKSVKVERVDIAELQRQAAEAQKKGKDKKKK